jgi:hypothetical protein
MTVMRPEDAGTGDGRQQFSTAPLIGFRDHTLLEVEHHEALSRQRF